MGFKNLFKVRKPGNGSGFEARVKAASVSARRTSVVKKDNSQNSSGKKGVK